MAYIFTKFVKGSNDGYTIMEFNEGQVVEETVLSQELKDAWLEQGIIKVLGNEPKEADVDTEQTNEETDEPEETDDGVLTDDELVAEAKQLLNEADVDTDKLKEIGIRLNIKNMEKTVNSDTIINKMKKFIEEYEK